jgi:[FeFe] hydrogenase H-cluster maturation GTPase HydF
MNQTPRSNRIHIGIFGNRNAGKSSLINAITNQDIALVSNHLGTTTDPVYKSMEINPIGPVVIIDTAGIDDYGDLGEKRIKKTKEVLNKTDIALIVFDTTTSFIEEQKLIKELKQRNKPFILVQNKIDESKKINVPIELSKETIILVSTITKEGIDTLKKQIVKHTKVEEDMFQLVGDLLHPGDFVVLVTPIDKAAPKGRLILPQQQTIRDILESDCISIVTKEHELKHTLENLKQKPKLVITDSQEFLKVSADTPNDILLTSFSILFARQKGDLEELVKGAKAINHLKSGDKILISEGCTHHRQSDDIGTVKIPRWLRQYTGLDFEFEYTSGYGFKEDMSDIKLVIHCGACMLNKTEMNARIEYVKSQNIPIVNYGVLISYVQGIFDRALDPFPYIKEVYQS